MVWINPEKRRLKTCDSSTARNQTISRTTRALIGMSVLTCATWSSGCAFIFDFANERIDEELDAAGFEETLIPAVQVTQNPQAPLEVEITVSEDNPQFDLPPGIDTSNWGYIISSSNFGLDEGKAPMFEFDASEIIYSSNSPVHFSVDVRSRDGKVTPALDAPSGSTGAVPECEFDLPAGSADDTTLVAQFGTSMGSCLASWVATNGIPNDMSFSVMTSIEGFRSGDAAPTSAPGYELRGKMTLKAERNAEAKQFAKVKLRPQDIEALDAIYANRDIIDLKDIVLKITTQWTAGAFVASPSPSCLNYNGAVLVRGFGYLPRTTPGAQGIAIVFSAMMSEGVTSIYELRVDYEGEDAYEVRTGNRTAVQTRPSNKTDFLMDIVDVIGEHAENYSGVGDFHLPVTGAYVMEGPCPRAGSIEATFAGKPSYDPNNQQ